jgi:drug/metabolite transporter (DMT)-like permease
MAILSGSIEPIVVKMGYLTTRVSPLQLLLVKNLTAAMLIVPLTRSFRWIGWSGIGRIASVSLLLLVNNGCALFALSRLPAVTMITIVTTTPAVVALVNQARGTVSLTAKFWLGFWMCFFGVLFTVDVFHKGGFAIDSLGVLGAAGAVTASTGYRVRMESLTREFTPKLVSTFVFLINAVAALVLIAPWQPLIPLQALPMGLWIGFAGAVANVAFIAALHLVGSTNISVLLMFERPFIIVTAALVCHERLSLLQFTGTLMVLAGIQFAKAPRKSPA